MAEYVTKDKVQEVVEKVIAPYIPTLIRRYERLPLELAIAIRDMDTEEVVERSKVDKAVEEIESYNVKANYEGSDSYLIGICNGLDKAAEILEKNLGVDHERDTETSN